MMCRVWCPKQHREKLDKTVYPVEARPEKPNFETTLWEPGDIAVQYMERYFERLLCPENATVCVEQADGKVLEFGYGHWRL